MQRWPYKYDPIFHREVPYRYVAEALGKTIVIFEGVYLERRPASEIARLVGLTKARG